MPKKPSKKAEREAAAWNKKHSIRTPVYYWRGIRGENTLEGFTSGSAWVLGGHTAVVCIEGEAGCIGLTHVDPKPSR